MDRFLVPRKRTIEQEHAAHMKSSSSSMSKKRKADSGGVMSGFAALSAANRASSRHPASSFNRTSSSSSSSSAFSSSPASFASGKGKQLSIEQLRKVTVVENVEAMEGVLRSARDRLDLKGILSILQQLDSVFMTRQTLEKSGIGKTVNQLPKQLEALMEERGDAADSHQLSEPKGDNKENEERGRASAIDLVDDADIEEEEKEVYGGHSTGDSNGSRPSSSCASISSASTCSSTPASLLSSISSLSSALVSRWKSQVLREIEVEKDEAKTFSTYTTHSDRLRTLKSLYFRITTKDEREGWGERIRRRQECQEATAKDPAALQVAAEIERQLFKLHHSAVVKQKQARAGKAAELLSAQREDADAPVTVIPPSYFSHARMLSNALMSNKDEMDEIRRLVTDIEDQSASDEERTTIIIALIQRTKPLNM